MRVSIVFCALVAVSGCDFLERADFLGNFKRQPKPEDSTPLSEQGLGRLAKGEFLKAQALFDQALRANPRDVHALLGKGIVYQQTGQLGLARQAFEAVLSLRPGPDKKLMVMNNLRPYSVGELASVNLALLQSQGVPSAFGGQRGQVQGQTQQQVPQQGLVGPQGQIPRRAPAVTPAQPSGQQFGQPAMRKPMPAPQMISASDKNVIARFETLKVLRDQGLITPDEYTVRRNVNRGALLKMTAPPPAAGLQRPVPSTEQITQRLRAIGRALELRAITIRQHGAERTMIIDGLMPAKPKTRGNQGTPPKGLMQAAERVRGLEGLRDKGLISQDEYAKERAAIEKTLAPPPAAKQKPMVKKEAAKPAALSGPKPAVHIASFRSRQAATRGWAQLRRAHRSLLGKLKSEISRVNLGRGKGVFYRLNAGPLKSQAEAARICKQLKRRRQFCEPAFMSAG